jgi:hypothetical protein
VGVGVDVSRVSRRSLLQLVAVSAVGASLAGCSGDDAPTSQPPTTATSPSPGSDAPTTSATIGAGDADVELVHAVLADEQRLLSVVAAARAAHPSLKEALDPRIRIQDLHLDTLRGSLAEPPAQPPSTTPHLPRRLRDLDRFLARQLEATARRRSADCMAARSGALARLMASMSASHSVGAAAWKQAR